VCDSLRTRMTFLQVGRRPKEPAAGRSRTRALTFVGSTVPEVPAEPCGSSSPLVSAVGSVELAQFEVAKLVDWKYGVLDSRTVRGDAQVVLCYVV